MAQAVVDTTGQKFYDLGVQATEARLNKELAGVCREYCLEVWTGTLNVAEAPTNSKWRKAENLFYLEDLRDDLKAAPEEATFTLTMVEQPPPSQVIPLPSEATKEPGKAGDQGRGWRWSKVRKLTRVGPDQMTKARARKPLSRQRSLSWSSLRPWPKRRRPLILPSSRWLANKTLPQRRLSLGFLSLPFCIFSLRSFFLSLYFYFL